MCSSSSFHLRGRSTLYLVALLFKVCLFLVVTHLLHAGNLRRYTGGRRRRKTRPPGESRDHPSRPRLKSPLTTAPHPSPDRKEEPSSNSEHKLNGNLRVSRRVGHTGDPRRRIGF